MARFRRLVTEHRIAAAIVAAVLVAFTVWGAAGRLFRGGPAALPPSAAVGRPSPAASTGGAGATGTSGAAPNGGNPLTGQIETDRGAGSTLSTASGAHSAPSDGAVTGGTPATGTAPTGQAPAAGAPGASTPPPPGAGRPDPFLPLASAGGTAASGSRPPLSLPPVPPLAPGALGPGGLTAIGPGGPSTAAAAGPRGSLHLTGIVTGPVAAVAILNDAGGSYIVTPGDTVASGVRVVAIDVKSRSVTVALNNQSWQLGLEGGTSK